jgi:hypothetical protein
MISVINISYDYFSVKCFYCFWLKQAKNRLILKLKYKLIHRKFSKQKTENREQNLFIELLIYSGDAKLKLD